MSILIIAPTRAERSYTIAAEVFAEMWAKVSGETLTISTEDDGASDLVLIGSDSANGVAARFILDAKLPQPSIIYGSDGYAIVSSNLNGRQVLHLAGGRGRSTLYAVYDYFERAAGCRYFWDGDIIPTGVRPLLCGMNIYESPRFEYRGLRYFAHRSLHRFQAEHWSLEDWRREIDWMLKKRLNMFMLRIGMDDLFQKAFPDIVDYPSNNAKLPEAGSGYDDRTTFWSLKYRGELRKNLLAYAFERDFMHPEDCGTMTHWYSRTPIQYLKKVKPSLCVQSTDSCYAEETGLVWNVLDDDNLDAYFKLTKTHIEHYGRPDLFHTIGFAERRYSTDDALNLRMKLYIYRKIAHFLQENYPNAPLMIASWDFWHKYTPEEVQRLVAELNPKQSIILDYTSDSARENNFTRWNVVGKFPYIFGIFQGYEPDNDVRGNYDLTEERLKIAADDEYCKGLVLWPELSHSDTFMTEFLADNAWSPLKYTMDERIDKYAFDRYRTDTAKMASIWRKFMPLVKTSHWSPGYGFAPTDLFFNLHWFGSHDKNYRGNMRERLVELIPNAVELLNELSKVNYTADEFIRRDAYDIARTVCGRYINLALLILHRRYNRWLNGAELDRESFEALFGVLLSLYESLGEILAGHEDYSMYLSLERLKSVTEVNPLFEETLKNNASCTYCRSYIYENVKFLYQPEIKTLIADIRQSFDENRRTAVNEDYYKKLCESAGKHYDSLSLEDMRPLKIKPLEAVIGDVANVITKINVW